MVQRVHASSRRLLLQRTGWVAFQHKDQQLVLDYNLKFRIWGIDDSVVKDWDEQTALPVSHKHKTATEHYGYAAFDFSSVTINELVSAIRPSTRRTTRRTMMTRYQFCFVGVFKSSNDCSCIITMHVSIGMKMAQL